MSAPFARLNQALAGRYRIESELAEGGMANVYRASDLRHGRPVALKAMKPEFALALGSERFLEEIRTTAALQHPHILPLFDSGVADGVLFFVTPLIEGESLRQRLDRVQLLPVKQAVSLTTSACMALDFAHSKGVVHRDIKPGNLLLDEQGELLVADFGIARGEPGADAERLTATGISLGTPAYMSPEQATGDPAVGPRSDVFSLACVLYEMLTGEPPFGAATPQGVVGRVLATDLRPVRSLRPNLPPHIDHALARALEAIPADRFASAGDFARALQDPEFRYGPELTSRSWIDDWRSRAASTVAVASLVLAVWLVARPVAPPLNVIQLDLDLGGEPYDVSSDMIVSRDGSRFAFAAPPGTNRGIFLRERSSSSFRLLAGTAEARYPAFSPDGRWIVYRDWRSDALMRVSTDGGAPRTVLPHGHLGHPQDPYWGDDGWVVFAFDRGLARVPADGGAPEVMLEGIDWVSSPRSLPGGEAIVMTNRRAGSVVALDLRTDSVHLLAAEGVDPVYVDTGHLLFAHPAGGLLALRFDPATLATQGSPMPVQEGVRVPGLAHFAISETGMLVYGIGEALTDDERRVLVQLEFDGGRRVLTPEPGRFETPRWAPDGSSVVYIDGEAGQRHVFLLDVVTGVSTQITFEGDNQSPVWSPDGSWIAFSSVREGTAAADLFIRELASNRPDSAVGLRVHPQHPKQWLADGRILFEDGASPNDVWSIRPDGSDALPYLESTEADYDDPAVAGGATWAAYQSDETGVEAVYVRPFPLAGQPVRVSRAEGQYPRWGPASDTLTAPVLYYWLAQESVSDTLERARLNTAPPRSVADRTPVAVGAFDPEHWDLHPGGESMLVAQTLTDASGVRGERFVVILNWIETLKDRMADSSGGPP